MAKATTLNAAGNREQITDVLTLSEPEMTPVTSAAPKKQATATFPEWQVDALQEPSFGGVDEGKDVDSFENKAVNRVKLGNYIQKWRRTFQVSDIQELVDTAGVPSEFARSQALATREIKRDVEAAICSSQDRQQQAGAGTPYKTRGIFRWLGFNGTAGGNYPSDVPASQQYTNFVDFGAGLTETEFNDLMQNMYSENGMPNGTLMCVASPNTRHEISLFSRADTTSNDSTLSVTQPADSKKITLNVRQYDGDFGMVNIVPASLFLDRTSDSATVPTDRALLLDTGSYCLFTLKAESRSELEDQGGGRRGFCEVIAALGVDSPKAHGVLYS